MDWPSREKADMDVNELQSQTRDVLTGCGAIVALLVRRRILGGRN